MRSMKAILSMAVFLGAFASFEFAADAKPATLTCVGVYSETSDGTVGSRVAKGDWVAIKVGDVIPAGADVKINVDRDWVEFIATGKPTTVYELDGPLDGKEIVKSAADILKGKSRAVSFPKGTKDKPDLKYKDKLVVTGYLGRQFYMTTDGDQKEIKYGDVLQRGGKVKIIATNNTLSLQNSAGASTTIIGPLNFAVDQVLDNKSLYKYLNVQK
jgi:hypothetical protein